MENLINDSKMNLRTFSPRSPNDNTIDNEFANVVKGVYDIFIESGGPDSYLGTDENIFLNESILNDTFIVNNITKSNATDINGEEDVTELIIMAVTSVLLGLMILITVIGNVFVIAAIILERNLQNVANYLVASLAVADLLVACLVMPLGAVYEISQGWILGPELCDIWTSCDVLCCTASILHLVAIATDRYWAVTNVDYIHSRTSGRVTTMIALVWISSIIVSLAPQFGWKDPEYMQRIEKQKCMVSQDLAYQVFATCSTFYVPLLVILVLYWKIYQTARKRIHRRRPKQTVSANNNQKETPNFKVYIGDQHAKHDPAIKLKVAPPKTKSRLRFRLASKFTSSQGKCAVSSLGLVEGNSTNTVNTVEETEYSSNVDKKGNDVTTFNNIEIEEPQCSAQISTVSHQISNQNAQQLQSQPGLTTAVQNTNLTPIIQHHHNQNQISTQQIPQPQTTTTTSSSSNVPNLHTQVKTRKETLEAKRERKAAKTLAIITGAFVVCWLPFFLMALLMPLFESNINDKVASFFLWLGYFNSTLNPVIYTIFSPEFRQAFKRILFGTHRGGYYRGGKL